MHGELSIFTWSFCPLQKFNGHILKLTILAAFIVISGPGHMVEAMQKTVLPGMSFLTMQKTAFVHLREIKKKPY